MYNTGKDLRVNLLINLNNRNCFTLATKCFWHIYLALKELHSSAIYVSLSTSLTHSSSMSMSMYSPYWPSSPVSCFHLVTWCVLFWPLCEFDLLPPWLVFASSSCCIRLCFVRRFWNHTFTWNNRYDRIEKSFPSEISLHLKHGKILICYVKIVCQKLPSFLSSLM